MCDENRGKPYGSDIDIEFPSDVDIIETLFKIRPASPRGFRVELIINSESIGLFKIRAANLLLSAMHTAGPKNVDLGVVTADVSVAEAAAKKMSETSWGRAKKRSVKFWRFMLWLLGTK